MAHQSANYLCHGIQLKTWTLFKNSEFLRGVTFSISDKNPVQPLPKVYNKSAKVVPLEELQKMEPSKLWTTHPPTQWEDVLQLIPENAIGHPGTKSSGPDILFRTKGPMIGWAAKLLSATSGMQWKLVRDEI